MRTRTALFTLTGVGLLVSAWTLILAWAKLQAGAANALDLGIYTQVAWNTAHGHLFQFTIHPGLYLGDHAEFLLALAAIPYRIVQSPLTLVALQSLAVVGAAFALFRFTRRSLSTTAALGFATLFLLNPFTLNALAFEFHAILFGLPFAFLAATAFLDRNLRQFWLWSILLFLTREDLTLLVAGFALLNALQRKTFREAIFNLLDRRGVQWTLLPGLGAVIWFVGASMLAGSINGEGYKFLSLLRPEGAHAAAVGTSFLAAFRPENFLVIVALLIPVLGLPLLAWRWLTLLILPFIGIGLAGFGSGDLILETHYAAFFLPGLFCATVLGWQRLVQRPPHWFSTFGEHGPRLALLTLGIAMVYSTATFGPTVQGARAWAAVTPADTRKATAAQELAASTPTDKPVLAGYSTLVSFASRPRVYASHYAFLGKRQYSDRPYPVPDDLGLVVLDSQDFATYELQYASRADRTDDYTTGAERFLTLLQSRGLHLTRVEDTLLTFEPQGTDLFPTLVTRQPAAELTSGEDFRLQTRETQLLVQPPGKVILNLIGQVRKVELPNVQVQLRWYDAGGKLLESRLLPLGYGLYPTRGWSPADAITTTFMLDVPTRAARGTVQALVPSGALQLNGWRAAVPALNEKTTQRFGEPLALTLQR